MNSHKKNKKSKKGREPTGPAGPIDGNIHTQETAGSDTQPEIEILRKENEILKKDLKTREEENKRFENENQDLKNEKTNILRENEQLKYELKKLKEIVEKYGNIDNRVPQSSEMEEILCEPCTVDTYGSSQNTLQKSANWQSTSSKSAVYFASARADHEDWSKSVPNTEVGWVVPECETDSASGWDKNMTVMDQEQNYEDSYGEEGRRNHRNYDRQEKQKTWPKHGNEFRNENEYGNRERRGNAYKHYPDNEQIDMRRPRGGPDFQHHRHLQGRKGNERQFMNNRRRGEYQQQCYDKNKEQFSKLKIVETDGDLFSAPQDHSLAHCVAADLRMGSGIAVQFKQQFKKVGELANQRKKVGQVAILEENGRFIYYLITKKLSTGKPRLSDLKDSLEDMKKHVEENQVKNIAIPRLGCGLDRLHWRDVRQLLQDIFAHVDVTITVYNFTIEMQSSTDQPPKKPLIRISDHFMKLVNIESETLLVVFGSECGYVDETMQELDKKFRFIYDYKNTPKNLGDVLEFWKCKELICILIVKKNKDDLMSYSALENCLWTLKKSFRKNKYTYMGFQAFMDDNDDLTVAKIVTLLKFVFANIECNTWVCWPDEMKSIYEDHYQPKDTYINPSQKYYD